MTRIERQARLLGFKSTFCYVQYYLLYVAIFLSSALYFGCAGRQDSISMAQYRLFMIKNTFNYCSLPPRPPVDRWHWQR
jgi:hypothetical protein